MKVKDSNGNSDDSNTGHRKRLREKFKNSGLSGFHDYEAVELLLTFAVPRRDVKPLAKRLIKKFSGLRGVFDASIDELQTVSGIGENAAVLIKLMKEVAAEYLRERSMKKDVIRSSEDVIKYLTLKLSGEKTEKFLALYLNTKNEVLSVDTIHEGTIDQTFVYPRKIIEKAFSHNARSIILVHNHPSGDPTPSRNDHKLTREIVNAAKTVDLIIHDHIIVGKDKYVSGRDLGWFGRR